MYHAPVKITLADNQLKFDSCSNSALYILNDSLEGPRVPFEAK